MATHRRVNRPRFERNVHALLSLCARPRLPAELHPELARRAALISDWDDALPTAEHHGIAPLLYYHLRAAGVAVPLTTAQQLQGLYVRHRRANRIRLTALREILDTLEAQQIQTLVMKGPALMGLVYAEPALRPTADLDLLVAAGDIFRAGDVLRRLGFRVPGRETGATLRHHHHLPMATRPTDGLLLQVELHHHALSRDYGATLRLDASREPPMTFDLGGRAASTFGAHEMLWHLCQHLVGPLPRRLRLIGIADVIGLAECSCERLDWDRIERQYAIILNVLALAHALTPLPTTVLHHLPPRVLDGLRDIGEDPDAWSSPSDPGPGRERRLLAFMRTVSPPRWWLRLRYGTGNTVGLVPRQLRHTAVVWRAVGRRAWRTLEGGREV